MSLAEEQRDLARTRIRRAAQAVLAERGFRATIEEIAAAAGVSSRTVFRHYAGHDQLIAEAVAGIYDELGQPISDLPDPNVDLHGWLAVLSLTAHTRNAKILGRAFWDVRNPDPDVSPAILDALAEQWPKRRRWMNYIVKRSWEAAGGEGSPPRSLVEAFSLQFSAFTTQALAVEFGHTPEQSASLATSILTVTLASAVELRDAGSR